MERICRQGTGRVVGKRVQLENGDFGTVTYYDRYEKVFLIEMEDKDKYADKFDPVGIVYADRDSFTVLK